ncbi:VOC family protein [Thermocoleostomius sinensis]|uniref:VOC family protein n=1 Tax=Thermocoleostomius sinensis A174 TaxID=2016057 RepID=A0A9E8ZFG5_9CYAN|nr:VOC family protein [Thermocoleostomius sinensis]WAL62394.1 VOC family protein [Thermocoleostomius sinensis A174]
MNFQRFEHINLSCHDIDASKTFYQTLFPDWFVRAEGEWQGDRWIHLGNQQFYLALNHQPAMKRERQPYREIGINHVGLVIENGEKMKMSLEANNIEYYTMSSPETKFRIYVNDPDGNEIELVEYQADYALK